MRKVCDRVSMDIELKTATDSEPGESIPGHLPGSGHGDDIDSVQ